MIAKSGRMRTFSGWEAKTTGWGRPSQGLGSESETAVCRAEPPPSQPFPSYGPPQQTAPFSQFGQGAGVSQQQTFQPQPLQPAFQPPPPVQPIPPAFQPQPLQPTFQPQPVQPAFRPQPVQPAFQPQPVQPAFQPQPVQPRPRPQPQPQQPQQSHDHDHDHHAGLDWLRDSVPGEPGVDYPIFSYQNKPETGFSCNGRVTGGYYADVQARCQVFWVCAPDPLQGLRPVAFLCPNGTIYNQQAFTCDWWFNVECQSSEGFYGLNDEIGKVPEGAGQFQTQVRSEIPHHHHHLALLSYTGHAVTDNEKRWEFFSD
ncbi:unnamed protein product [Darwinula stevensoni]|uniref:Chitin-binding type-2 domain-containing protein n=1 Tax=Darwinula stevensoni TaxID=69355 RepID=A0A7R8X6W6_9CRUS|nr:unnamed protein product [Darwinula stevensoni]CAG0881698.1 unnamed protein product [Darwinula stevensoni]